MTVPEQSTRIPIAKPSLGEAEADAAAPGRSCSRLGDAGAGGRGVRARVRGASSARAHACAVSNCTTALHLALLAVGVGPGDEVITVSHSFIATANAIRYCGATPVFVDIEPDTFNMDPALIEAAIDAADPGDPVRPPDRACRAIWRRSSPIAPAPRPAASIEDAACAIGSEILLGRRAGSGSASRTATSPASRSIRAR